jgi:hypothetical protein
MGNQLLDQYSLLHYASGIIAYFWGIPIEVFFAAHVSFEVIENTNSGMKFINETLTFWPGGKPRADSFTNIIGDNISALLGYYSAYKLDDTGKRNKWYTT